MSRLKADVEARLVIAVVLAVPVALAFLVYWEFLSLWFWTDDFLWLEAATNPDLSDSLTDAFTYPRGATPYWRPLIDLHFFSMYRLFGMDGTAYHVLNVLIHSGTAALLGLLTLRLTRSGVTATLAASLFAISPTYATMVPWASGATALYAGLFSVVTVLLFIDYLQRDRAYGNVLLAALTFAVALLAKEDAAALLGILALSALVLRTPKRPHDLLDLGVTLLPFLVVWLAYILPQLILVVGSSESPRFSYGWHALPNLFHGLAWLSLPWPEFLGDWVSPARWAAFATFTSIAVLATLRRQLLVPSVYAATAIMLVPPAFFTGDFAPRWTYLATMPWAVFIAVLLVAAYNWLSNQNRFVGLAAGVTVTAWLFVLLAGRTIDAHVWIPGLAGEYQEIERAITTGCADLRDDANVYIFPLPIGGSGFREFAVPELVRTIRSGATVYMVGRSPTPPQPEPNDCGLAWNRVTGYTAVLIE